MEKVELDKISKLSPENEKVVKLTLERNIYCVGCVALSICLSVAIYFLF